MWTRFLFLYPLLSRFRLIYMRCINEWKQYEVEILCPSQPAKLPNSAHFVVSFQRLNLMHITYFTLLLHDPPKLFIPKSHSVTGNEHTIRLKNEKNIKSFFTEICICDYVTYLEIHNTWFVCPFLLINTNNI